VLVIYTSQPHCHVTAPFCTAQRGEAGAVKRPAHSEPFHAFSSLRCFALCSLSSPGAQHARQREHAGLECTHASLTAHEKAHQWVTHTDRSVSTHRHCTPQSKCQQTTSTFPFSDTTHSNHRTHTHTHEAAGWDVQTHGIRGSNVHVRKGGSPCHASRRAYRSGTDPWWPGHTHTHTHTQLPCLRMYQFSQSVSQFI
jgi:hypothetical protein